MKIDKNQTSVTISLTQSPSKYLDDNRYIQGVFSTGPALKVLSMEMVPPNKEIDWFCQKKYGTGPAQEKKMTGSAQHIENG